MCMLLLAIQLDATQCSQHTTTLALQAMELPLPNNDMLFVDVKVCGITYLYAVEEQVPAGELTAEFTRCQQHDMLCGCLYHHSLMC